MRLGGNRRILAGALYLPLCVWNAFSGVTRTNFKDKGHFRYGSPSVAHKLNLRFEIGPDNSLVHIKI